MAKFIPGPIVAEIRNSLGSTTFSRNQSGAYARARAGGGGARTPAQVVTRDRLAAAAAAWNSPLTDAQRLAWHAYARALTDRNGPLRGREWSGRSAFMSSFKNLDTIGVATLTDPPDQPEAGNVTALILAVDTDARTFTLDGQVPAGTPSQGLIVLATPPLNAGRFFGWHLAKQIAAVAPGFAFPLELWDEYREIFQAPAAGQAVIAFVHPVAEGSGLAGVRQASRVLATGSGVAVLQRITTLTDAQIKALPTTPLTIVPAVAGKIIVPIQVALQLDASAGAYTNISAGNANYIHWDIGGVFSNLTRNDLFLNTATKRYAPLTTRVLNDAIPNAVLELYNQRVGEGSVVAAPLELKSLNAAGAFTGGNAANTLKVTTFYELVDAI